MHHISFGSRALPGPAGGAYSAPQTPYSCIRRGLLLRERGRIARGKERERRREGKGRKRRVRGREGNAPHMTYLHDAPDTLVSLRSSDSAKISTKNRSKKQNDHLNKITQNTTYVIQ